MTREPQHTAYGGSVSEWIACTPGTLEDLPVGMWKIVNDGREGFGLEGDALVDFIRRSIYALIDAGAKPVIASGKPSKWELQVQYGSNKREIAEGVIHEWLRQGAPTPEVWTGLWFGRPWSYLPDESA
jgi:hypothetical protein